MTGRHAFARRRSERLCHAAEGYLEQDRERLCGNFRCRAPGGTRYIAGCAVKAGSLCYLALNDPVVSAAAQSVRESCLRFSPWRAAPNRPWGASRSRSRCSSAAARNFSGSIRSRTSATGSSARSPTRRLAPPASKRAARSSSAGMTSSYVDAGVMKGNYSARAILKSARRAIARRSSGASGSNSISEGGAATWYGRLLRYPLPTIHGCYWRNRPR